MMMPLAWPITSRLTRAALRWSVRWASASASAASVANSSMIRSSCALNAAGCAAYRVSAPRVRSLIHNGAQVVHADQGLFACRLDAGTLSGFLLLYVQDLERLPGRGLGYELSGLHRSRPRPST